MSLFDAGPFETGKKKRVAAQQIAPEVEPVTIDHWWTAVARNQPGVVHAIHTRQAAGPMIGAGAVLAWCGRYVVPMTFTVGDKANGCSRCVAAGAPVHRRSVA